MKLFSQIRSWQYFLKASKAIGNTHWNLAPVGNSVWKKEYVNSFALSLDAFPVPKDARWIVDVGANIGLFSKAACLYCPNATVVSIEPSSQALKALSENTEDSPRIRKIHSALGESEGIVTLNIAKHLASSSLKALTTESNENYGAGIAFTGETEDVRVTTLPNVMNELNIDHIDLLKIDVEGYEPEVLKGAASVLSSKVSRIWVELSVARLSFDQIIAQMMLIKNLGFTLVNIVDVSRSEFKHGSPVTQFDAWFLREQ